MFAIFSQIKSHSLQWIDKTLAKAANTTQQMLAEWMMALYSGMILDINSLLKTSNIKLTNDFVARESHESFRTINNKQVLNLMGV